jgi:hypothetical protein
MTRTILFVLITAMGADGARAAADDVVFADFEASTYSP